MICRFAPSARQELLQATAWYLSEGGPAVAEAFEWTVKRALQLLASMPRLGSPLQGAGVRAWPLKRFPYTLVYRVKGDELVVLAVAHQSREPGYWQGGQRTR